MDESDEGSEDLNLFREGEAYVTDIMVGGVEGRSKEAIAASGGLHIIGTNRHESARIDQQLRGRAARQGDPGSSQFIISMDY